CAARKSPRNAIEGSSLNICVQSGATWKSFTFELSTTMARSIFSFDRMGRTSSYPNANPDKKKRKFVNLQSLTIYA
ncbi:MAG TPA: hypothetical protein PK470_08840, partial [Candidatus Omnitrophota bacterium]|nr:hypothetical protein [Candidatus Omnitrophota bacterium]